MSWAVEPGGSRVAFCFEGAEADRVRRREIFVLLTENIFSNGVLVSRGDCSDECKRAHIYLFDGGRRTDVNVSTLGARDLSKKVSSSKGRQTVRSLADMVDAAFIRAFEHVVDADLFVVSERRVGWELRDPLAGVASQFYEVNPAWLAAARVAVVELARLSNQIVSLEERLIVLRQDSELGSWFETRRARKARITLASNTAEEIERSHVLAYQEVAEMSF